MRISDIDSAYFAGLIDGEGTISLIRKHKGGTRVPVVSLPSTTWEIITKFKRKLGGCVIAKKTYAAHHKPSWECRLIHCAAIDLARQVLPYLAHPEKIRRARLLTQTYKNVTSPNGKYPGHMSLLRQKFVEEFFKNSQTVGEL